MCGNRFNEMFGMADPDVDEVFFITVFFFNLLCLK